MGNLSKSIFIPKLLNNNPPAPCSLINLDFLLPHTAYFDESTDFTFFVFAILVFYSLFSFYTSNNRITLFYRLI